MLSPATSVLCLLPLCSGVLYPNPATAAGPLDGTYRGSLVLGANRNSRCAPGSPTSVIVKDSVFTWRLGTQRTLVTLEPDGSFKAQNGRRFISGKVTGSTLTAETRGEYCDYTWNLTK